MVAPMRLFGNFYSSPTIMSLLRSFKNKVPSGRNDGKKYTKSRESSIGAIVSSILFISDNNDNYISTTYA